MPLDAFAGTVSSAKPWTSMSAIGSAGERAKPWMRAPAMGATCPGRNRAAPNAHMARLWDISGGNAKSVDWIGFIGLLREREIIL